MNQPIKTALSANVKKLLREAESTLHHSLKDDIEAAYKDAEGVLDPVAAAIVNHINTLRSVFIAVEYLLETPPLERLAGGVLHGALMLNVSFLRLSSTANDTQGILVNGCGDDEPLYKYKGDGVILEAINAGQLLKDVINDLQGAI